MVVLVDTNIIIDYIRQKDKANTLFHSSFIDAKNSAAVTLTTVTELWQGESMIRVSNQERIEELMKKLEIVIPNLETAKLAGKVLRESKYKISFQDAEIASCAIYFDLPLMTKNARDFSKIIGLKLYSTNE